MKKRIVLIIVSMLLVSAGFSQKAEKTDTAKAIAHQSRSAAATVNMFTSESDNIKADEIYNMRENFASVGHEDVTLPLSPYLATGISLSNGMYIGAIGYFNLNDDTSDLQTLQPKTHTTTTYDSTYDVQVAFALNNYMGFHYNFYRDGVKKIENWDAHEEGVNITNGSIITDESYWEHELAFAMKLENDMEFLVPLRIYFSEDKIETETVVEVTPTSITTTNSVDDAGSEVRVSLKPGFSMPFNFGAINKLSFGAGIDFAVQSNLNMFEESETVDDGSNTTTVKTTQDANANYVNMDWFVSFTPSLEWDLNNAVFFKSEPSVVFTHSVKSDGVKQERFVDGVGGGDSDAFTSTNKFIPSISLPLGVEYRPQDWFKLRFGASYSLSWTIINAVDQDDNVQVGYANASSFSLQAGCGFIIEENFLIDIKYGADFSDLNVAVKPDFLDTAASVQFTYTF